MNIDGDDDDLAGGGNAAPATTPEPEEEEELEPGQESEVEGEAEGEVEGEAAPAKPAGRRERREDNLRELIEENRRARAEAEQARREFEAARNRPDPREEQARLAAMDPEERVLYLARQEANSLRYQGVQQEVRFTARIDKMEFKELVSANPQYKKYETQVEQYFANGMNAALQQGNPNAMMTRENILKHLVGDDVLKNGGKALAAARTRAQKNIQSQTTRPANVGSNASRQRGGESAASAAEKRLRASGILVD